MKETSSSELLNQWMGNPDYQVRWEESCQAKMKELIQRALAITPEALARAEVKISTSRRHDLTEVLISVGEPESTVIRLTSRPRQRPRLELSTALQRGVGGRAPSRPIFSSQEGLSPRSTRATVEMNLERLEERLAAAAGFAAEAAAPKAD